MQAKQTMQTGDPKYVELLIGNLKETFKAIEKFLLIGFTSALVLVVLAINDRQLVGTEKVMFTGSSAPAVVVALVALGAYFVCGAFAAFYFATRRRIVKKLHDEAPQFLEALLMYPSLVAKIDAPQIVALLCVAISGLTALLLFYVPTHGVEKAVFAFAVIGSPYLVLVGMAFWAGVDERNWSGGDKRTR
jgi:hypothetical protein